MRQSVRKIATLEEFWAIPEPERFHELIGGELIEKAAPSGEHGDAQAGIVGAVRPPFQRKSGRGGPGGWWIATEVEDLLEGGEIVRPDVVGWRRERCPERPVGSPVRLRPDWVCEVISPDNAKNDTVKKLRLYQSASIPYYWIADPRDATLTVMRWTEDGYVTRGRAAARSVVMWCDRSPSRPSSFTSARCLATTRRSEGKAARALAKRTGITAPRDPSRNSVSFRRRGKLRVPSPATEARRSVPARWSRENRRSSN